jgi:hypothetical protein
MAKFVNNEAIYYLQLSSLWMEMTGYDSDGAASQMS